MEKTKLHLSFSNRWFSLKEEANKFISEYGLIWVGLVIVQLVVYTYLFTAVIFTNHTFPNVCLYDYPSFKTHGEGRWMADLIILIQGRSGVQSLQMALAVTLQAFNGILLALLVGVTGRVRIILVSAIVCFYPAFLDYYAFSIDHLTFVLGDTLALSGACILLKSGKNLVRIIGGSILFTLSMAAYGPKIALVGLLAAIVLLLSFSRQSEKASILKGWLSWVEPFIVVGITLILSAVIFWITTRLSINYDIGVRTHTNKPGEMISEALRAYSWTGNYFLKPGAFPPLLRLIPALMIAIGIFVLAWDIFKKHGIMVLICALIVIALMPIALRLSYIINSSSWPDTGRIVSANGYALAFFIAYGIRQNWQQWIVIPLASISLYFYVTLAVQENNSAIYKTVYDLNYINRISARVESVITSTENYSQTLVIIGNYPDFPRDQFVKYPYLGAQSHFRTHSFANYRQIDIINFFIGKQIFKHPTEDEVKKAVSSVNGRSSWPSPESVYSIDHTVVVLLEPFKPGIQITN